MKKQIESSSGFSLIELSMVLMISTLLLLALMRVFDAYGDAIQQEKSTRVVQNGQTVMARFYDLEGRYPCPAKPLPQTDPNYGLEDCSITPVNGARDTNNKLGLSDDQVLVGVMPFRANKRDDAGNILFDAGVPIIIPLAGLVEKNEILQTSLVDPWGNVMTYAVTGSMTKKSSFDSYRGAIRIRDEYNRDTGGTNKNAHFAIVSHGPDLIGGVSAQSGNLSLPCDATHALENFNCNGGSVFVASLMNRNESSAASYYDDRVSFATRVPVSLWNKMTVAGVTSDDTLTTMTTGNVGIRTPTPREKLEVGKWEDVVSGTMTADKSTIKADRITDASQICDTSGTCFTPNSLLDTRCLNPSQYITKIDVVVDAFNVSRLRAHCENLVFQPNTTAQLNCDDLRNGIAGYLTGLYTDGSILCGAHP